MFSVEMLFQKSGATKTGLAFRIPAYVGTESRDPEGVLPLRSLQVTKATGRRHSRNIEGQSYEEIYMNHEHI